MPLRQCIGCGEMKSKKEMIRVLKTADDTIEIDATGRRNGRGAYLCPSMDCWKKAVKSKGLEPGRSRWRFRRKSMRRWKRRWSSLENRKKVLNLLGLATRAGKTASGEFMTEKAIKSGKAYLVIVSEEASDNTKKMFENSCAYYKVPVYQFGMKEELGHAMGKEMRASLAVLDSGFAKALREKLDD